MAVEERVVSGFRCERCGNRWIPQNVVTGPPERFPEELLPTVCPELQEHPVGISPVEGRKGQGNPSRQFELP